MKKKSLLLLGILLALAGCKGGDITPENNTSAGGSISEVSLSATTIDVQQGKQSGDITVTVRGEGDFNKHVSLKSDDETIAMPSIKEAESGDTFKVQGKKAGNTTIKITSLQDETKAASLSVHVKTKEESIEPVVTTLYVSPEESQILKVGEPGAEITVTINGNGLYNKKASVVSENTAIATVSKSEVSTTEKFTINPVSEGLTKVTVTSLGDSTKKAEIVVKVNKKDDIVPPSPIESVALDCTEKTLDKGETFKVTARVVGEPLVWSLEGEGANSVISYEEVQGETAVNVTAFAAGTATLVASVGAKSSRCVFTVNEKEYVEDIRTIYFSNNIGWETVYCYPFGNGNDAEFIDGSVEMTFVELDEFNQKVYSTDIDFNEYNQVIFHDGNGAQTVDIELSMLTEGKDGFYLAKDGEDNFVKDESDHYTVSTYKFEHYEYVPADPVYKDIYFTNNITWTKVYYFAFGPRVSGGEWAERPEMTFVEKNEYNQDVYKATVDTNEITTIIFTSDEEQTVDIALSSLEEGNDGFYIAQNEDTSWSKTDDKFNVGQYKFEHYEPTPVEPDVKTFYFYNPYTTFTNFGIYLFNSTSGANNGEWPGVEFTGETVLSDDDKACYVLDIDVNQYDKFVLTAKEEDELKQTYDVVFAEHEDANMFGFDTSVEAWTETSEGSNVWKNIAACGTFVAPGLKINVTPKQKTLAVNEEFNFTVEVKNGSGVTYSTEAINVELSNESDTGFTVKALAVGEASIKVMCGDVTEYANVKVVENRVSNPVTVYFTNSMNAAKLAAKAWEGTAEDTIDFNSDAIDGKKEYKNEFGQDVYSFEIDQGLNDCLVFFDKDTTTTRTTVIGLDGVQTGCAWYAGEKQADLFTTGAWTYHETKTVVLKISGFTDWANADATFFVWYWDEDNGVNGASVKLTAVAGRPYVFDAQIPTAANHLLFIRAKDGQETFVESDFKPEVVWNQTEDLTLNGITNTYSITGWDSGEWVND